MEKPEAKILGADGNIFTLLAIASSALKKEGLNDQAKEMFDKAIKTDAYESAINIILEYIVPIECDNPVSGGFYVD